MKIIHEGHEEHEENFDVGQVSIPANGLRLRKPPYDSAGLDLLVSFVPFVDQKEITRRLHATPCTSPQQAHPAPSTS